MIGSPPSTCVTSSSGSSRFGRIHSASASPARPRNGGNGVHGRGDAEAGLAEVIEEPVPVDGWRLQEAYVELDDGMRFECASFGGVPETAARRIAAELVASAEAAGGSSTASTSAARSRSSTGKSRGSGPTTSAWSSACEAPSQ